MKDSYYVGVVRMNLSDNLKILLLKLRESVEVPLIYIQVLIGTEIERQLRTLNSLGAYSQTPSVEDARKLKKQQILLCEIVIKYAQEEANFIATLREDGIYDRVHPL